MIVSVWLCYSLSVTVSLSHSRHGVTLSLIMIPAYLFESFLGGLIFDLHSEQMCEWVYLRYNFDSFRGPDIFTNTKENEINPTPGPTDNANVKLATDYTRAWCQLVPPLQKGYIEYIRLRNLCSRISTYSNERILPSSINNTCFDQSAIRVP